MTGSPPVFTKSVSGAHDSPILFGSTTDVLKGILAKIGTESVTTSYYSLAAPKPTPFLAVNLNI
jgi:hypothetical protein